MDRPGKSFDSSCASNTRKLDKLLDDCTDLEKKTLKDLEKVIYYETLHHSAWRRIKSDLSTQYDDTFDQAGYLKGQAAINRLIHNRYVQDLEHNQKITEILESTISPKSSINSNVFKFDNLKNVHMLKQFSKHKRKFGEVWKPVLKNRPILCTDFSPKTCKNGTSQALKHVWTESFGPKKLIQQDGKSELIFSSPKSHIPSTRDSVIYSGRESIIHDSQINRLLSESIHDRKEFLPELNTSKLQKFDSKFTERVSLRTSTGKATREIYKREYTKHRQNLESLLSLEKMIIRSANKEQLAARKERQNTKAFTKRIKDDKEV